MGWGDQLRGMRQVAGAGRKAGYEMTGEFIDRQNQKQLCVQPVTDEPNIFKQCFSELLFGNVFKSTGQIWGMLTG